MGTLHNHALTRYYGFMSHKTYSKLVFHSGDNISFQSINCTGSGN